MNESPDADAKVIEQLDEEKLAKRAEEIAAKKVSELQDNLVKSLKPERKGYSNFDEMYADIDRRAETKAEAKAREVEDRINKRLEDDRKAEKEDREKTVKQREEENRKEWAQMSAEWREAVQDGIAPPVADEVAKKLRDGVKYDDLSEDERKDPGLTFYNDARQHHAELKKQGKSTSFYRTISQYATRKPAGASAPVFGGSVATPPPDEEEYSYEDTAEKRREIFGF